MTFAIYIGNFQLIKMFIERTVLRLKKAAKLPNSSFNPEVQKLFPLLIAFEYENKELFSYWIENHYYLF